MAMATLAIVNPSKKPSQREASATAKTAKAKKAKAKPATKAAKSADMTLKIEVDTVAKQPAKKAAAKATTKKGRARPNFPRTEAQERRYKKRRKATAQLVASGVTGFYANPRRRPKRRRNPIAGVGMGDIGKLLKGAVVGAGGAIAVDAVWKYVPSSITDKLGTGMGQSAGRLGLALLLGVVAQKVAGKKAFIKDAVEGSMIVNVHSVMKDTLNTAIPSLGLAGGGASPTNRVNWDFSQSSMNGLPLNGLPLAGSPSMSINSPLGAGALHGLNLEGEYI